MTVTITFLYFWNDGNDGDHNAQTKVEADEKLVGFATVRLNKKYYLSKSIKSYLEITFVQIFIENLLYSSSCDNNY